MEQLDTIFSSTFTKLGVDSNNLAIVLSEPVGIPNIQRELTAQLMFEKYNISGLFSQMDASLAMYATGRVSGVMVDVGAFSTRAVPIYDGYPIQTATRTVPYGGETVTELVTRMLREGQGLAVTEDQAREAKERFVFCTPSAATDDALAGASVGVERSFTLPDGTAISVGDAMAEAGKALFAPDRPTGFNTPVIGIPELVHCSYYATPPGYRPELAKSLVLCGGGSMVKDIADRVEVEMRARIPATAETEACVMAPPDRAAMSWRGGCILSSLKSFSQVMVTKKDYDEVGPVIVHRKS